MMAANDPADDVDAAAAAWMAHGRAGPMAEPARQRFSTWLAADPRHAAAFARYEQLWDALDDAREDPIIARMRRQDGWRRRRWWLMPLGGVAAAAAALAVVIWPGAPSGRGRTEPGRPVLRFETGLGQVSRIALGDGSQLVLDTDSAIEARLDSASRRIRVLRGRAFFTVAHERRPFIVSGRRMSVTATGTQFSVSLTAGTDHVGMVEGSVLARPLDAKQAVQIALVGGRGLDAADDGRWVVSHVDPRREREWTSGTLTFRDQRLDVIAAELNRYSARKVRFADNEVAAARLSAVLKAGDTETFVTGVTDLSLAKVVRRDAGGLVLSAH